MAHLRIVCSASPWRQTCSMPVLALFMRLTFGDMRVALLLGSRLQQPQTLFLTLSRVARRGRGSDRFRVGQIIVHKRYSYRGVITGWDRTCEADEDWMEQMNVEALPSAPALSAASSASSP